jgi:hypothetical protein
MNIAIHSVVARLSRSVHFSCEKPVAVCPTVRQRVWSFSDQGLLPSVRRVCALLRDSTLQALEFSDKCTLVLLPKGAFYFGTRKHDSVVKCSKQIIAHLFRKLKRKRGVGQAVSLPTTRNGALISRMNDGGFPAPISVMEQHSKEHKGLVLHPKVSRRLHRRLMLHLLFYLGIFGPGFIAANAGNDPGGIATYSSMGSQFGYQMLWVMVVLTVGMGLEGWQDYLKRTGEASTRTRKRPKGLSRRSFPL